MSIKSDTLVTADSKAATQAAAPSVGKAEVQSQQQKMNTTAGSQTTVPLTDKMKVEDEDQVDVESDVQVTAPLTALLREETAVQQHVDDKQDPQVPTPTVAKGEAPDEQQQVDITSGRGLEASLENKEGQAGQQQQQQQIGPESEQNMADGQPSVPSHDKSKEQHELLETGIKSGTLATADAKPATPAAAPSAGKTELQSHRQEMDSASGSQATAPSTEKMEVQDENHVDVGSDAPVTAPLKEETSRQPHVDAKLVLQVPAPAVTGGGAPDEKQQVDIESDREVKSPLENMEVQDGHQPQQLNVGLDSKIVAPSSKMEMKGQQQPAGGQVDDVVVPLDNMKAQGNNKVQIGGTDSQTVVPSKKHLEVYPAADVGSDRQATAILEGTAVAQYLDQTTNVPAENMKAASKSGVRQQHEVDVEVDEIASGASQGLVCGKGKCRARDEVLKVDTQANRVGIEASVKSAGGRKVVNCNAGVTVAASASASVVCPSAAVSSAGPTTAQRAVLPESAGTVLVSAFAACASTRMETVTTQSAPGLMRFLLNPQCAPHLRRFTTQTSAQLSSPVLASAVHGLREGLEANQGELQPNQRPLSDHSFAVVTLAKRLMTQDFGQLAVGTVCTVAKDVLWLASGVDGTGGLEQVFAGAVLCVRDENVRQSRLKGVLELEVVKNAVRGSNVFWRALAEARLEKLKGLRPPEFSWSQPEANVPGHPAVTQFLRGNNRDFIYAGMNNIRHARNFAAKHFRGAYNSYEKHSAHAFPAGRGASAYVTISKTDACHRMLMNNYSGLTAEAQELRTLIAADATRPALSTLTLQFNCDATRPAATAQPGSVATSAAEKRPADVLSRAHHGAAGVSSIQGTATQQQLQSSTALANVASNKKPRIEDEGDEVVVVGGTKRVVEVVDLCDSD